MRPDVKLGVAISFVVVVVAGGYYMYRDSRELPIPVSGDMGVLASRTTPTDRIAIKEGHGGADSKRRTKPKRRSSTRDSSRNRSNDQLVVGLGKSGKSSDRRKRPDISSTPHRGDTTTRANGKSSPLTTRDRKKGPSSTSAASDRTASRDRTKDSAARQSSGLTDTTHRNADRKGSEKRRNRSTRTKDDSAAANRSPVGKNQRSTTANPAMRSDTATAGRHGSSRDRSQSGIDRPSAGTEPRARKNRTSSSRKAGTPTTVAVETHRLQPGDTLAALAMSYYGSERYVRLLVDANPHITDPDRLRVGTIVKIPASPDDGTRSPQDLANRAVLDSHLRGKDSTDGRTRTYTVQAGDSFYAIAKSQLGDASQWQKLFELNKHLVHGDPKRLQVGQVIALPK